MQFRGSTCSLILNATATQYTTKSMVSPAFTDSEVVIVHCSHMCIPVHPPWLPAYMDVVQTVLVILRMAGLFLGRPHMCVCVCKSINVYI